jgi:hypothetical protein
VPSPVIADIFVTNHPVTKIFAHADMTKRIIIIVSISIHLVTLVETGAGGRLSGVPTATGTSGRARLLQGLLVAL